MPLWKRPKKLFSMLPVLFHIAISNAINHLISIYRIKPLALKMTPSDHMQAGTINSILRPR
jgi:hypothetical protein